VFESLLLKRDKITKEDKVTKLGLMDKHETKTILNSILKNNTRKYVNKNSKYGSDNEIRYFNSDIYCPGYQFYNNFLG
jgi:hypothetical protein